MIHEWFMSFGWLAALLVILPAFIIPRISKKSANSDDRQGAAMAFFFFGAIAAAAWVVGIVLLLAGVSAAIAGWIGCFFAGVAIGVGRNAG